MKYHFNSEDELNDYISQQFLPQEAAYSLKDLGFDEPCLASFDDMGRFKSPFDIDLEERDNPNKLLCSNKDFLTFNRGWCATPTYQQAIDWLRTKGIDIRNDSVMREDPYWKITDIHSKHIIGHHAILHMAILGGAEWLEEQQTK